MDTTNTFISTGMSAGLYVLYKLAQRYYFKSGCHNNTLEITVVDKEEVKKDDEKKEKEKELVEIKSS